VALVVNCRIDGFDCSLIKIDSGVVEVNGTASCPYDALSIDSNIAEFLSSSFYANNAMITKDLSPRAKIQLVKAAEMARCQLISAACADVFIDSFADGLDLSVQLTRTQIDEIAKQHLIPKFHQCFDSLVRLNGVRIEDVQEVILFGEIAKVVNIPQKITDRFRQLEHVSYIAPSDYAVLGNALYHADCCWKGSGIESVALDCLRSSISVKTYTSGGCEGKTEILKLTQTRPCRTSINIDTSRQNAEGILLKFYVSEELPEKYALLCEIAVPFPDGEIEPFWVKKNIWQLTFESSARTDLSDITVRNAKLGILIDIDRSCTGVLTVKAGRCVPITPHIRENWRVLEGPP
jgi:molecular chaperone DnaK (HSP70)